MHARVAERGEEGKGAGVDEGVRAAWERGGGGWRERSPPCVQCSAWCDSMVANFPPLCHTVVHHWFPLPLSSHAPLLPAPRPPPPPSFSRPSNPPSSLAPDNNPPCATFALLSISLALCCFLCRLKISPPCPSCLPLCPSPCSNCATPPPTPHYARRYRPSPPPPTPPVSPRSSRLLSPRPPVLALLLLLLPIPFSHPQVVRFSSWTRPRVA